MKINVRGFTDIIKRMLPKTKRDNMKVVLKKGSYTVSGKTFILKKEPIMKGIDQYNLLDEETKKKFKKAAGDMMTNYVIKRDFNVKLRETIIMGGFAWDNTPEGFHFWNTQHEFILNHSRGK